METDPTGGCRLPGVCEVSQWGVEEADWGTTAVLGAANGRQEVHEHDVKNLPHSLRISLFGVATAFKAAAAASMQVTRVTLRTFEERSYALRRRHTHGDTPTSPPPSAAHLVWPQVKQLQSNGCKPCSMLEASTS